MPTATSITEKNQRLEECDVMPVYRKKRNARNRDVRSMDLAEESQNHK